MEWKKNTFEVNQSKVPANERQLRAINVESTIELPRFIVGPDKRAGCLRVKFITCLASPLHGVYANCWLIQKSCRRQLHKSLQWRVSHRKFRESRFVGTWSDLRKEGVNKTAVAILLFQRISFACYYATTVYTGTSLSLHVCFWSWEVTLVGTCRWEGNFYS